MGGDVHLGAGVAIDQEDIEIEGALGADGEFGDALKAGEGSGRPGSGVVGGNKEGAVDEAGSFRLLG